MIIVHYEVYVLEGRGWMLHARFPRPERETAIAEAKELEQSLGVKVRVLRETYYTDDNTFEESEVYASSGTPAKAAMPARQPPAAPPRQAAAQPSARPAAAGKPGSAPHTAAKPKPKLPPPPPPRRRTRPAKSPEETAHARSFFARLLAIVALALAAALLAINLTPNAIMLLWHMGLSLTITSEAYGRLQVFVFAGTFLMVAVPLAVRFLPRRHARRSHGKVTLDWGLGNAPPGSDLERERAVKKSLDKLAAQALAEEMRGAGRHDEEADDRDDDKDDAPLRNPADDDLPEILPGPDNVPLPEIRPDPEDVKDAPPARDDKPQKAEKQDKPEKQDKAEKPDKKDGKGAKKEEAVTAESLQPTVMRFLDGAVAQAKNLVPNMDAFTKFALHLYMAGAVETLCDFRKLGDGAKAKLVGVALETLGTRGDLARKFYDKLEEYLLEPRYLGVVQAGRDAMGDFMLGDEAGAHRALRDAILEWTRKSDKKAQIVTVMFTDMVGSTDMTQARGDAAAQEVVRRHNSIVRGALAQFGGKEIKHTGDGIMASFPTAAAAVEASISIQHNVDQHNQRLPNQSLHLRIGLNAGEPIEEEDDLFGATVQLAARVCAATNADQVLCTGVVKDLTVGKGAGSFRSIGEKYLKGFKDAVPLFEVMWH
ncbi:MAG: adenylate/guanylate cyclase domain-containing protein [Bacteroidales bacterium]